MAGKLVVFEGTDGSGKSTQLELMCQRLQQDGHSFRRLIFPRYEEPSSMLVRMYLQGAFGSNPSDVNAYAASTFYAVDRFASYATDWKEYYASGGLLLADRYTTSNAIHQAAKLQKEERPVFFQWLSDFEYEKLGLPRPDLVLYFDMPTEYAVSLLRKRESATGTKGDIHEVDELYLAACRTAALEAAAFWGWRCIPCVKNRVLRTPEELLEEIIPIIWEVKE